MAETLVKIVGATTSKCSLASGYLVNGQATIYIPISKVQFDTALCTDLATHITHGHIRVYIDGVLQTANDMDNLVGRPMDEAPKEHTDFQESVLSRFDNTAALPASPADGARYWALVTANGWTINRIYEWQAGEAAWADVIPTTGTQVYVEADSMLYLWNGSALVSFAEGTQIKCRITGINMKAVAAYTGVTTGISTDFFIPTHLTFRLTAAAGAPLNGDAIVTIGSSLGGTQILGPTVLPGLTVINTTYSIPITGALAVALAANSTIHCNTTGADSSGGTATAEIWITGFSI
jgi:hypothetical protein